MTQININNCVDRTASDFLLVDGEGYEISFKRLENKNVFKIHAGHTQFMKIVGDFNLKPKWSTWVNNEDPKKRGQYVEVK